MVGHEFNFKVVESGAWPEKHVQLLGQWDALIVHEPGFSPTFAVMESLADAVCDLTASVSPLQVPHQTGLGLITPLTFPSPSIYRPDHRLTLIPRSAFELFGSYVEGLDWLSWVENFRKRSEQFGFIHYSAPGCVIPNSEIPEKATYASSPFLEVHQLHASIANRRLTIVIDGTCLSKDLTTGTHQLIASTAIGLADLPDQVSVTVVAPVESHNLLRALFGNHQHLEFKTKKDWGDKIADIVYRPYQIYSVEELVWCRTHSRRFIISQLDMIAFDNPTYFPRETLYFETRNLIRSSLQAADGVVFISDFARRSVCARVPALDPNRYTVIRCGTNHVSVDNAPKTARPECLRESKFTNFILCLSGSFAHKNRPFAVRVFREMRRLGYTGSLVFAGPDPHYGSGRDLVLHEIKASETDVAESVCFLSLVDAPTKWWLLAEADAVIYPSVVEGFGLVPFEAANVGTPCLMHRSTAAEEIFGSSTTLAESWDPTEWAQTLLEWQRHNTQRELQVTSILQQSEQLTWSLATGEFLGFAKSIVSMPANLPTGSVSEGGYFERYPSLLWNRTPIQRLARFSRRAASFLDRKILGFIRLK
jgi:Glycosyl transferases group 1